MTTIADSIRDAILQYGITKVDGMLVYAYEVNGKG